MQNCEDAAVVRFPVGKALVQTLDFFTPIVNDPFAFGQIAVANALSDVYAMGGSPYVVMNIVCFPAATMDVCILQEILRGGLSKIHESGAFLVGGHSVQDQEIKYGLSVSGVIDPDHVATNSGLRPGDALILTKPIGSGVLATALKADWPGADTYESEIVAWGTRLNRIPGQAIENFALLAATDITGFGLGGHLLEMALASDCSIHLDLACVPLMRGAHELAGSGLVPVGSHANKQFCQARVQHAPGLDPVLVDLMFDAQTSGGLVLGVAPPLVDPVCTWLVERGEMAVVVGHVQPAQTNGTRLFLCSG